MPAAQAADALDDIVNDLLRRLRAGDSVTWPGLGTFLPAGENISFVAEVPAAKPEAKADARRRRA